MGKKAIPSKIMELKGGRDHLHCKADYNRDEPTMETSLPECPTHLGPLAKQEWKRAGALLVKVKVMTELDRAVLAGYCQAFGEWLEAIAYVQENGPTVLNVSGLPAVSPWVKIVNDAYSKWMKAAVLLGLSPSSRVSLKMNESIKDPVDRVAEFMARKGE